jgi:hypothetical protein
MITLIHGAILWGDFTEKFHQGAIFEKFHQRVDFTEKFQLGSLG